MVALAEARYTTPQGATRVREALLRDRRSYDRFLRLQMGASVKRAEGATVVSFLGSANVDREVESFGIPERRNNQSAGLSLRITGNGGGQEVVELLGLPKEDAVNVTDATVSAIPGSAQEAGKIVFTLQERVGAFASERTISIQTDKNDQHGLHTHVVDEVVIGS